MNTALGRNDGQVHVLEILVATKNQSSKIRRQGPRNPKTATMSHYTAIGETIFTPVTRSDGDRFLLGKKLTRVFEIFAKVYYFK